MKNPGSKPNRGEMPIIGYVKVPVRLWSCDLDKKMQWSAGGAFFWAADAVVDVTSDSPNELDGHFGGNMAGGMGYSLKNKDKKFYGEMYPEDFYKELVKVLDKIDSEKLQTIIDEYGNPGIPHLCKFSIAKKAAKAKKIAEEQIEKKKNILALMESLKDKKEIPKEIPPEKDNLGDDIINLNKFGDKKRIQILEDGGWDLKQCFDDCDYTYLGESYNKNIFPPDDKIILDPQWGTNVKFMELDRPKKNTYVTDSERKDWKVYLEIHSYLGISIGAQHYYGSLKFSMPAINKIGMKPGWTSSSFDNPKGFDLNHIDLTRPLTIKEMKNDPNRYEVYRKGDRVNLWYSIDKIKEKAREAFSKIFTDPKWKLIIEDKY